MAHHQPQITKTITHNKHKSPVTHKSLSLTTSSTSNQQQIQITNSTSSIKHKTHKTLGSDSHLQNLDQQRQSSKTQNPPNPRNDSHPQNSDRRKTNTAKP